MKKIEILKTKIKQLFCIHKHKVPVIDVRYVPRKAGESDRYDVCIEVVCTRCKKIVRTKVFASDVKHSHLAVVINCAKRSGKKLVDKK